MYFLNILSFLIIFTFTIVHCDIIHLKTSKDNEKLKESGSQRVIFGLGSPGVLASNPRNLFAQVDGHLRACDMDTKLAYVDCHEYHLEDVCDIESADRNFLLLVLTDKTREDALYLKPVKGKLDKFYLLNLILQFYSVTWNNFYNVTTAKEVRRAIEANPQKDWFLCYADKENTIGQSMCFELAAIYRKKSAISNIYTEKATLLGQLEKHIGAKGRMGNEIGAEIVVPMEGVGLWYLDCLEDEEVQCTAYQYFMGESMERINEFVNIVRYQPVMNMLPDGSIKNMNNLDPSLLYHIYRGSQFPTDTDKMESTMDEYEIATQIRGNAIVVSVDADQMGKGTLETLGVNRNRDKFPMWKFRSNMEEKKKTYHTIKGCPVEYIKSHFKSMQAMAKSVETEPPSNLPASQAMCSSQSDMPTDPNMQDDEVELLLQAQRDQACYFCPRDSKRVTVLTDKTYKAFIEKRKVAMVLFWLNVDTSSRAALAVTIEASTLLDTNYAPFGAVACHDWPDICQKALVKTWPKMMVFLDGQQSREYKGMWEPKLLANSAMLYAAPALARLNSETAAEKFLDGKMIALVNGSYLQTVTIAVYKNDKAREINAVTEAAKRLHGQYALGLATGTWVKKWVNDRLGPLQLPIISTHKNNDELEKAVLMDEVEEATPESIIRFVQKSSRPVIAPLNRVTFPSVINRQVPVIALIGSNPKETEFFAIMRNAEQCLLSQNYVCVTLDADEEKNLTRYLLNAYGVKDDELPIVVYVNTKNGHVHILEKDATKKCIKTWTEHINSKMLKPNVILPEKTWEQSPLMYDYLKLSMKDTMKKMGHQDESTAWKVNIENEQLKEKNVNMHEEL